MPNQTGQTGLLQSCQALSGEELAVIAGLTYSECCHACGIAQAEDQETARSRLASKEQKGTCMGSVISVGDMMLRNNIIPSCTASYGCGGSSEGMEILCAKRAKICYSIQMIAVQSLIAP